MGTKINSLEERWPFRERWRTYDHVTFWIYTIGCIGLGALLHWSCS